MRNLIPDRPYLAALLACFLTTTALAQEEAPLPESAADKLVAFQEEEGDDDVPVLPPTVVEAELPETGEQQMFPPLPSSFDGPFDAPYPISPFISPPVDGYNAGSATTGTRFNLPILEFPGTIQAVPQDLINDQGAVELNDLVRDVAGLTQQSGNGGRMEFYLLRGFPLNGGPGGLIRKDGFLDVSRAERDIANLDRVEVLSGPASVIYGGGQPAGTLNLITKKPLFEPLTGADLFLGSWDFYRATADISRPLNEDQTVLFRTNIATQASRSFRDFIYHDRVFVAPAVTFVLSDVTFLTVQGDFLYHEGKEDPLLVAPIGTNLKSIPVNTFYGEPDDFWRVVDGQINVTLDHEINDSLSLYAGWVSNWSKERRFLFSNAGFANGNTEVTRRFFDQHTLSQDHQFIGNIYGDVEMPLFRHQWLIGTELGTMLGDQMQLRSSVGFNIDVFDPVYDTPQPHLTPATAAVNRDIYLQVDQFGYYAQDLVNITEQLKFMAGVKFHDVRNLLINNVSGGVNDDRLRAFTQRYGLLYEVVPEMLSVYGMYAESFNPEPGVDFFGNKFDPETGTIWEGGIKFAVSDEFGVYVAGYDIRRGDVSVPDPDHPGFSIQVGEVASRGFDCGMTGYLSEDWSVSCNCAYVDVRVTEDTRGDFVGLRTPSVPYFSSSIWSHYNLINSCDRRFGVSLGMVQVGNREGALSTDPTQRFDLPTYIRWDAAVDYQVGRALFQLNLENLFDVQYYAGSSSRLAVNPGAPFNALGTLRYRY